MASYSTLAGIMMWLLVRCNFRRRGVQRPANATAGTKSLGNLPVESGYSTVELQLECTLMIVWHHDHGRCYKTFLNVI